MELITQIKYDHCFAKSFVRQMNLSFYKVTYKSTNFDKQLRQYLGLSLFPFEEVLNKSLGLLLS